MELEHTFTVPVGVKQAWDVLLDVPRIAPCMPGATLTDYSDDGFSGTVKVKLGPVNMTYKGTGKFAERDEAARKVVIVASGRESRGSGTASATVTTSLHPQGDDQTEVRVHTDLKVTGRPAQFGRGVLADVGAKLIGQFADCLAGQLRGPTEAPIAGSAAGSSPVTESPAAAGEARDGDRGAAAGDRPQDSLAGVPTAAEVEAIDLLEVTGAADLLKKFGPYALAFAAGVVLAWLLGGRRRS